MKNRNQSHGFVLFAVSVLLFSMFACNSDESEGITTTFEQYYSIDPQSLLESLEKESFTPVDTVPEIPLPDQQIPVNWNQADYLRIVDAVFKNAWDESVEGWSLKSMSFALNCTKIDYGFQNAHFRYFKNSRVQEREVRFERSIHIDPRSKSIYVLEFEYFPRLTDWDSVDLAQVRYSADDALRITEENAGQEQRLTVENECDISLLLSPDSPRYRGWDVRYTNRNDGTILLIQIDPLAGEIHIP